MPRGDGATWQCARSMKMTGQSSTDKDEDNGAAVLRAHVQQADRRRGHGKFNNYPKTGGKIARDMATNVLTQQEHREQMEWERKFADRCQALAAARTTSTTESTESPTTWRPRRRGSTVVMAPSALTMPPKTGTHRPVMAMKEAVERAATAPTLAAPPRARHSVRGEVGGI